MFSLWALIGLLDIYINKNLKKYYSDGLLTKLMLKYASTKNQRIREVNTATENACVQKKHENINTIWLCADENVQRKIESNGHK